MIVQANVAQPQIIERKTWLDAMLGRLGGLAQIGGEAMKGYLAFQQAQTSKDTIREAAMRYALTLPTDEGKVYLKSLGFSDQEIASYESINGRMAELSHRYGMNVIKEKGLGGFFDPTGKYGPQTGARTQAPPATMNTSTGMKKIDKPGDEMQYGPVQDTPVPSPLLPGTMDASKMAYFNEPPSYRGPVERHNQIPQVGQGNPALEQANFLAQLVGNPMFGGSNPFGGGQAWQS